MYVSKSFVKRRPPTKSNVKICQLQRKPKSESQQQIRYELKTHKTAKYFQLVSVGMPFTFLDKVYFKICQG